uniref:Lipoprotein n=1 Tax=Desulfobacca acetoxidans TaxID=60893 RepID=A0A7V6A3G0_9BACT
MKTWFFTLTGVLLITGLMIAGCAKPTVYPEHMNPRPFYNDSWWGSDPVCSPGCPTAPSGPW